jgi:integrase
MSTSADHRTAPDPLPVAFLTIRVVTRKGDDGERVEVPYYEAGFRYDGRYHHPRIGRAWLDRDGDKWAKRKGRVPDGYYDERRATVRAAELVAECVEAIRTGAAEQREKERRARMLTFRDLAEAFLYDAEHVRGLKPSTLLQHRRDIAEPGVEYKRGEGKTRGPIMGALGNKPAKEITAADVEQVLATVAATKVKDGTVNRYRAVMSAVFSFGVKKKGLKANPVSSTDRYGMGKPAGHRSLQFFDQDEIELLALMLEGGQYRKRDDNGSRWAGRHHGERTDAERASDRQDAEAVRVAAYTGIRKSELVALRWRDINFADAMLTVSHSISAGVESSPKSRKPRYIGLADPAAQALARLSQRKDFTGSDDYVFVNEVGGRLDGSALTRRYNQARDKAGLRSLVWHELRHTFGSLLADGGASPIAIKEAFGHADLETTMIYLHARMAREQAREFNAAFALAAQHRAMVDLLGGAGALVEPGQER